MRLVGDLGGTHCRLALADERGGLNDIQSFKAARYAGVEEVISHYLTQCKAQPESACLAVAGPTPRHAMVMTNLSWRTTSSALNQRFGFRHSAFINDFEAIALSLPALVSSHLLTIGGGAIDLSLPISVMGPGTGLGVALVIPLNESFRALPTEGGHTALQAQTPIEYAIFDYVRDQGLPLSRETFLSGPGLFRLYQALCVLENSPCQAKDGGEVSLLAAQGALLARQALAIFLALLGSAAGDQALACGSRGGVVLSGGILPKIREPLLNSSFRQRFEAKPPMQSYLEPISTSLIIHENPGLVGAALYPL